jgi:purine nucleosidase
LYNLNIVGFTLTSGNVGIDDVTRNIKTVQDFMKTDIKMYKGEEYINPDIEVATYAHGKHGLGNAVYPESSRKEEDMRAEDFLIEASKEYNDLSIICFGSLTNIANAIKKDPEFSSRINKIYIMGLSYEPDVNKKPYLEFNVSVNPEAAKLVFNTKFKEMNVITHEAALKVIISKEYIDSLKDSDKLLSNFVYQLAEKYIEFNISHYDIHGLSMPDPLTIASVIDPSVVKYTKASVDIVTEGDRKGESIIKMNEGDINIVSAIDVNKFKRMFENVFN